jgi:hypothetical protein
MPRVRGSDIPRNPVLRCPKTNKKVASLARCGLKFVVLLSPFLLLCAQRPALLLLPPFLAHRLGALHLGPPFRRP